MSWCELKHLPFLFCAIIMLGGCGFTPQYLKENQNLSLLLNQVYIPSIPDRNGQILRNYLTNFIGEISQPSKRYIFKVELAVEQRGIGYDKRLTTSRSEVLVRASYTFTDIQNPSLPPQKGFCRAAEHYGFSPYHIMQTLAAEKNAANRGLDLTAKCLIDRLSLLVRTHAAPVTLGKPSLTRKMQK